MSRLGTSRRESFTHRRNAVLHNCPHSSGGLRGSYRTTQTSACDWAGRLNPIGVSVLGALLSVVRVHIALMRVVVGL